MVFVHPQHASASVNTLTIPTTGSHTIACTQENTVHIGKIGSAALTTAVTLLRYGDTNFPQGINEVVVVVCGGGGEGGDEKRQLPTDSPTLWVK